MSGTVSFCSLTESLFLLRFLQLLPTAAVQDALGLFRWKRGSFRGEKLDIHHLYNAGQILLARGTITKSPIWMESSSVV